MRIDPLLDRITEIEGDIDTLREWGAAVQADTLEKACDRFRALIAEWLDEPLTITQADLECLWWKAGTLAKKVRKGDLAQAGTAGAPLVTRRDLFGVEGGHTADMAEWAEDLLDG